MDANQLYYKEYYKNFTLLEISLHRHPACHDPQAERKPDERIAELSEVCGIQSKITGKKDGYKQMNYYDEQNIKSADMIGLTCSLCKPVLMILGIVWIGQQITGAAHTSPLILSPPKAAPHFSKLIDAIGVVESNNNDDAVGDNGKSIGRYQIQKAYWIDGTEYLKVDWPYKDAHNPYKARKVVEAYLTRYGKGKTIEQLAAIHNSGPKGAEKLKTNKNIQEYVKKVLANLQK